MIIKAVCHWADRQPLLLCLCLLHGADALPIVTLLVSGGAGALLYVALLMCTPGLTTSVS